MAVKPLLEFTKQGIYCSAGNFYIDPWGITDYAIITHAHADHARVGASKYLCSLPCLPLLQVRLGKNIRAQALAWGETVYRHGVAISLFPAGHVLGSAQVRLAYKGQVWVVTGDFKRENDGLTEAFEPVKCNHIIMECTFGLPVYTWLPQANIAKQIIHWHEQNRLSGNNSVLYAYSLGKAQRLIQLLAPHINALYCHQTVAQINEAYYAAGSNLTKQWQALEAYETGTEALLIIPPGAASTKVLNKLGNHQTGMASGWMAVRGRKTQRKVDAGFVLSDHADWPALNQTVLDSEAEKIYLTHGYTAIFTRHLQSLGFEAQEVYSLFGTADEAEENYQTAPV